jgi:hypothetical protein
MWLKWSWWIVLIALAGCAQLVTPGATQSPLPSPLASPIAAPDGALIRLHRTGGFAGVDETWLIYGDGRIGYSGRGSGRAKQLTPDEMSSLLVAAQKVMQMGQPYMAQDLCCDRFIYDITIALDGQMKTVRTVDAAPDEPPAVTKLLAVITSAVK